MRGPVLIDGSHGEGGGQILRTSLTLAAWLGRACVISGIRSRRPRPGLAELRRERAKTLLEAAELAEAGKILDTHRSLAGTLAATEVAEGLIDGC